MATKAKTSGSPKRAPSRAKRSDAEVIADLKRSLKIADGWRNLSNGLGAAGIDPATSHRFAPEPRLEPIEAMYLYQGSDIAARYVDALPQEAFRRPFTLRLPGVKEKPARAVAKVLRNYQVREKLREVDKLGRATGGAGLLMITSGARKETLADELDLGNIDRLNSLTPFDARAAWAEEWDEDPDSIGYGYPATYRIDLAAAGLVGYGKPYRPRGVKIGARDPERSLLPKGGRGQIVVHRSRIALFGGAFTPMRERQENFGWDDSILRRFLPVLREVEFIWDSAANAIGNAAQAVYRMKGLLAKIGSGKTSEVVEQLRLLQLLRQMRIIPVDSDGETFEYVVNPLSGVDQIFGRGWERLAAAESTPLSILMGSAPPGLDASDTGGTRHWYDIVGDHQDSACLDPIERVVEVVLASNEGPLAGDIPDGWSVGFPPLWQQSDKEKADTELVSAQADQVRLDQRVISKRQVAGRFTGEGFSMQLPAMSTDEEAALNAPAEEPLTTLTGVQLGAMQEVVRACSASEIPVESANAMLVMGFGYTEEQAKKITDPIAAFQVQKKVEAEAAAAAQAEAARVAAEAAEKAAAEKAASEPPPEEEEPEEEPEDDEPTPAELSLIERLQAKAAAERAERAAA